MVKIGIVAHGIEGGLQDINDEDFIIAVDGGFYYLNLKPDLVVGDFDSFEESHLGEIPYRRFPKDKNESDTELALDIAFNEMKSEEVTLYSFFGKRVDHSLYNIYLLEKFPKLVLKQDNETLFLLKDQKTIEVEPGTVISLIPLSDVVAGVTTQGLKWELFEKDLTKRFMSLSNEALERVVHLSCQKGSLLVCIETKSEVWSPP
jgi:thiamine pyrophosphokinase